MNTNKQNYYELVPSCKVYQAKAIRVATFLGGPLVAGYLIAQNYKALNEHDKVKVTWACSVAATIVVFTIAFLMPASSGPLKYAIPLLYSWIAYYLVQQYQGAQLDTFANTGGEVYSWWRTIGISLIGVAITVALLFLVIIMLPVNLTQ